MTDTAAGRKPSSKIVPRKTPIPEQDSAAQIELWRGLARLFGRPGAAGGGALPQLSSRLRAGMPGPGPHPAVHQTGEGREVQGGP